MVHRHYTSLHACNQWCMFYYMDTMFSILCMLFFYIPCFCFCLPLSYILMMETCPTNALHIFLFLYLYMAFTWIFINPFFNVECLYWYNVCASIFPFTYLIYNMQPPHLCFLHGYQNCVSSTYLCHPILEMNKEMHDEGFFMATTKTISTHSDAFVINPEIPPSLLQPPHHISRH